MDLLYTSRLAIDHSYPHVPDLLSLRGCECLLANRPSFTTVKSRTAFDHSQEHSLKWIAEVMRAADPQPACDFLTVTQ